MSTLGTEHENAPAEEPANAPYVGVVPIVAVRDANAAAAFYERAFGAEILRRVPAGDGVRLLHCHLRINNGSLAINDVFPEHGYPLQEPQSFTLHLQVEDVDAWWARAVGAGAEITMPLEKQFWGDRYGQLRDPFGVSWSLGSSR
jgi:PhnB protein